MTDHATPRAGVELTDSPYAMLRLVVTLALMTLGGCAM